MILIYKLFITVKGHGTIKIEHAVDGSTDWQLMKHNGTESALGINATQWTTYMFQFGASINEDPGAIVGNPQYSIDPSIGDVSLKAIKSIRFRITASEVGTEETQAGVVGFELNDMTVFYRVKGIY